MIAWLMAAPRDSVPPLTRGFGFSASDWEPPVIKSYSYRSSFVKAGECIFTVRHLTISRKKAYF